MMKLYFAAAGALLLGTSALAWSPDSDGIDPAWKLAGVKASEQLKLAVNDELANTKEEPMAWADSALKAEPAAWTEGDPELQPAAATWIDDEVAKPADKIDKPVDDKPLVEDEPAPVAEPAPIADGVGGPLEPTEATALDLSPRPAAHNYPPCDPGPGDDNCIQLYEPGVRTALASWTGPTGGLAGSNEATAMGGPYEPVDELKTADATAAAETLDTADVAKVEDEVVEPDPIKEDIGAS